MGITNSSYPKDPKSTPENTPNKHSEPTQSTASSAPRGPRNKPRGSAQPQAPGPANKALPSSAYQVDQFHHEKNKGDAPVRRGSALPQKTPQGLDAPKPSIRSSRPPSPTIAALETSPTTTSRIPPITDGLRPTGFTTKWISTTKEYDHFEKHVVRQKEFPYATLQDYSEAASLFWEKPISPHPEPNIIEKNGKNGNLYRFEVASGILAIAKVQEHTDEVVLVSYFKPKIKCSNQPDRALDYYNNAC